MRMRKDALEESQHNILDVGSNDEVSINAVIELDSGNVTSAMALSLHFGRETSNDENWKNNGEKNRKTSKIRKQVWRELDITDLVTEARGQDWR